jgi:ubiquinone/menaquinone biosynthesis C-methylase UbiE
MIAEKDIPLPPKEYMELVCSFNLPNLIENFIESGGKDVVRMIDEQGMLSPGIDFLDIGCGCGRIARHLVEKPIRSYTGFDRHAGMIKWCQDEIAQRAPNFRFHYFDLKSIYALWDGHEGTVSVGSFHFPFPDESFDSILLASVFTHMPLEESAHYMKEIRRVLKPQGRVLLSVFFISKKPHVQEVNFFYVPDHFFRVVRRSGFTYRNLDPLHCEGVCHHNWFVLTRKSGGSMLACASSWLTEYRRKLWGFGDGPRGACGITSTPSRVN